MHLLPTLLLAFASAAPPADLAAVKAEPNLEKRAGLAMVFAMRRVDAAYQAWRDDRMKDVEAALDDTGAAAELARDSLKQTGKNASKHPKHFKKAELNARLLLRRLDSLINDFDVNARPPAERARARVQKVQEELLLAIMGGGKRR